AVVVLGEIDDADRGNGQLVMEGDLGSVVTQGPDLAGVKIAVDVGALECLEPVAVVDVATGERAELRVRLLDDRLEDRRRAFFPLGPEGVRAFHHAPAIVAAFFNLVNALPQVLADFADPEIAGLAVEAEFPRLPQAIGVKLRSSLLHADE